MNDVCIPRKGISSDMEYLNAVLNAVLQGIIQGVTEFLPVSSSGHLAIYQHLFGDSATSGLLFSVLLHVGTLFAVCLVYRKAIGALILEACRMIGDLFTGRLKGKKLNDERKTILMMILSSALLLIVVVPIFGGDSLKDLFEYTTDAENHRELFWVVGVMLLITAVLMFLAWRITSSDRPTHKCATVKDALLIGATQAAAVFPGLSRSGSTTAVALACGMNKKAATQYSFILSIPAVLAATLWEFKDAVTTPGAVEQVNWLAAAIGIVVSALVGIAAIKTFLWLIKKNRYVIFSIYCAAVGLFVIIWSVVENLSK